MRRALSVMRTSVKFQRKDSFVKCKEGKIKINVKDFKYKKFFVAMDASSHISKLIKSNSKYYTFVVSERVHEKGFMRDIYDSKLYRQFVKSLSQVGKQNYATLIFNTDGAPLFNSSTYSVWPIFVIVNELPVHVRTKELILVALWFGKDKPNMNVFLSPLVDQMDTLATKGIQCKINDKDFNVKVFTKVCCVERNTLNTREGVFRRGSVSPRGMHEAMHGADASCSPPTVVAERTLPAAELSPSGWPSREPYRQAFP